MGQDGENGKGVVMTDAERAQLAELEVDRVVRDSAAETESDRRSEYRLIYKTLIAFAIVAAIVVVRQAFFA